MRDYLSNRLTSVFAVTADAVRAGRGSGETGDLAHLVHRVQRGDLVRLGQGRVVEHGVDEVVDGAAAAHHGLADVDELGGAGAEHVDAEQLAGIEGDQQLQHAVGVTDDLAAGQLPVTRDADLERDAVLGQLLLGPPDEADFGNAVDADRVQLADLVQRLAAGVMRRDPALLHGGGRQRGKTDHVGDRVDVRDGGPEKLVHHDPAELIGGQAGRIEVKVVAHDLPPGRAQRGEHRAVLDADHARARDHHRAGHLLQVGDPVGINHGAVVNLDAGRSGGPGTGGDHDLVGRGPADPAVAVVDVHRVRVGETAGAGQDRDPVTGQLAAHHVHLAADHVAGTGGQVADRDVVLDPVARPVHLALVQAGQVQDRLTQGLGRDRAGVQADAADHVLALDDRHPPLELRRGDGCLLAAGPRADHQHVEVVHTI